MPGGDDSAQLLELHRRLLTGDRTASEEVITLLYALLIQEVSVRFRQTDEHIVWINYLHPRQQVIQALGEHIVEVLDGVRKATPSERAAAILSHLRLGAHTHLLPRHGQDEDSQWVVAAAEDRAERLARELVAPQERIHTLLQDLSTRATVDSEHACSTLAAYFGLPPYAFDDIFRTINQRRPVSFLGDIREALGRRE